MEGLLRRLRRRMEAFIRQQCTSGQATESLLTARNEIDQVLRELSNPNTPRASVREKICRVLIRLGEAGMFD